MTAINSVITASEPRAVALPEGRAVARIRAGSAKILDAWYATQFDADRLGRYGLAEAQQVTPDDARGYFLSPLLALLLAYLETGEGRYRDVYLDERLRFAPHRADPAVRSAFFAEILSKDEDAVASLAGSAASEQAIRQMMATVHAPLLEKAGKETIKLLAIGDCLLNEVRVFLRPRCSLNQVSLDMRCVYFSAALGKELSRAEVDAMMAETKYDLLAFSFFTYEGLPPYTALLREADQLTDAQIDSRVQALIALVEGYLGKLREHTEAPFLLHNVSGLPLTRYRKYLPGVPELSRNRKKVIDRLNEGLRQIADGMTNVLLVDERDAAVRFGLRNASRPAVPARMFRRAFFHTARFGQPLADAYVDVLQSYRDLRKAKVLFVDFDNTLWHGVMADGTVEHRLEEQKLLRRLKEAGIVLVALSKNDPKNIRWDEMLLKPEDFALLKINWNLKAQSIQEAAAELDLGIDSFVVIDDSAQERELIRSRLPKVRLLDSLDPNAWVSLERLLRFPNTRDTEESRERTEMYRAQAARRREQADTSAELDYPTMMAGLGLRLRFGKATSRELERLTELIQRTNQFNTTTVRYSKAEIAALIAKGAVYSAEVTDKFGSFGTVASVIVSREQSTMSIDSFVMSCRAMGFGLEQAMLRLVLDAERGVERAKGRFIPTDRNSPAATLYADNGFQQVDPELWVLDHPEKAPTVPAWIAVEGG